MIIFTVKYIERFTKWPIQQNSIFRELLFSSHPFSLLFTNPKENTEIKQFNIARHFNRKIHGRMELKGVAVHEQVLQKVYHEHFNPVSCALTEKCFNIGKLHLYPNFGTKAKYDCYLFSFKNLNNHSVIFRRKKVELDLDCLELSTWSNSVNLYPSNTV